jgi:hypothetical protein
MMEKATHRDGQAGLTIVEMLAVLALLSLTLGLTFELWQHALIVGDAAARALRNPSSVLLTARFRSDVHQAQEVPVAAEWQTGALELVGSDGVVTYRCVEDHLRREAPDGVVVLLGGVTEWRWRGPTPHVVELVVRWQAADEQRAALGIWRAPSEGRREVLLRCAHRGERSW